MPSLPSSPRRAAGQANRPGIAGAKVRKATSDNEFAIASITKTFTAALVLRLAEQGRMDLDEPLASYMGDLKVDTNGATVRQALEMRSGLADYPQPAAANHIRVDAAHVWTAEEMVAEMDPPIAAAGETYLYSSAAYELLGRAVEHVTGTGPAPRCGRSWSTRGTSAGSLTRTRTRDAQAVGSTDLHHLVPRTPADLGVGGAISCISSATYGSGAGSIASHAPSLAAWVWHLFAGDILSTASLGRMAPPGNGLAYGLGISAVWPWLDRRFRREYRLSRAVHDVPARPRRHRDLRHRPGVRRGTDGPGAPEGGDRILIRPVLQARVI